MCSDKKYTIAHFVSVIKHSVGLLGAMLWDVELVFVFSAYPSLQRVCSILISYCIWQIMLQ